MAQPIDPDAFNAFERAGWEPVTAAYAEGFGPLTAEAVGPLLDAVRAGSGMRLLDVASGPGYVSGVAADRGAAVVGVDVASEMIAEARRRYPSLEFRDGSAEALPFAASEFDAVAINFGLLHLGRPDEALREAHRVLKSNGRLGFTVWAARDKALGIGIVLDAIEAHGTPDVGIPVGPPFFRFSDAAECERTLRAAGFVDISVTEVPLQWRLPSARAYFDVMLNGTVRTAALLRGQTPEALAEIKGAVISEAQTYSAGLRGIEIPMPAMLSSAMKP
jgi:SAM-dependent methyltransferase